jgi:hypothetical protein
MLLLIVSHDLAGSALEQAKRRSIQSFRPP